MKLIGLMPLRNEDWICGLTVRVALMWCDELVCLNHASEDKTDDILSEIQAEEPTRLHVISTPEKQWSEMQHRQMMLDLARHKGATHIAIVDADEVLTGNLLRQSLFIESGFCLQLPGYNLRGSLNRYHANGVWSRRWFSTTFRDAAQLFWFEEGTRKEQFHHREPFGAKLDPYRPVDQGRGGVMHLWGVSDRRLRAKHALYKMTERLRWPDKNVETIDREYSWWKTGTAPNEAAQWVFNDVPLAWWEPYKHLTEHIQIYRQPWQEEECCRLAQQHGRGMFAGLDLFGVIG
jgi:hypothetical protein